MLRAERASSDIFDTLEALDLPGAEPYVVTVTTPGGTKPIAIASTPSMGFAIYYAAIREYLGFGVRLAQGERTLAASSA